MNGFTEGATLRDYFAGKAMEQHMARADNGNTLHIAQTEYELIARYSYEMADAMLKERIK